MRIVEIQDLMERGALLPKLKTQLELLLEAIIAWPNGLDSTEDFICALTLDIGSELSKSFITCRLIDIDPVSEAWAAESLAILIKLFDHAPSGISVSALVDSLESALLHTRQ